MNEGLLLEKNFFDKVIVEYWKCQSGLMLDCRCDT